MKKGIIFAALIALLVAFTGCDKKSTQSVDKFVGNYDLVIDYEAYMDGTLDETGVMEGTLTITAIDKSNVKIEGVVSLKGKEITLYETTGRLDDSGVLRLSSSSYSSGSIVFDISYNGITNKSPLVFNSTMTTTIEGYYVEYNMINTATKK